MKQIFRLINMKRVMLSLIAMTATALAAVAQTRENVIVLEDFVGGVNRTVSVPIYMNNSDEVIGIQFDIELPFSMPAGGTPRLGGRAQVHGHSASVHTVSAANTTYRVVMMNTANAPVAGNSGLLLSLPMAAQDKGVLSHKIKVSNVVLTDKKGNNIATSKTAECTYTVTREDLPDLTPASVTLSPTTLTPGEKVTIGYTAKNIGNGPTRSGWTEKYYLQSTVTDGRCYLGSVAYTGTLAAGGSVQRSLQFTIPSAPHVDGKVKAVVEMVPNHDTGELKVDDWNNTGVSAATVTLTKLLRLTYDKNTLNEGRVRYYGSYWSDDYITMKLTRTGDWSRAETFRVQCNVSGLLKLGSYVLPVNITIPAGSEGASFRIYAVDDQIVRTRECDVTIPQANGYNQVSCHITRIDNDRNPLTLKASAASVHEGQQLTITATRGGELTDHLKLTLSCSQPYRFTAPLTIEIPAGQTSGSVTTTAIHDNTPQLDGTVRFSTSPADYQSAAVTVSLLDDDRPAISAVCTPSIVAENAGEAASTVIVSRDRGLDQAMRVKLSSSRSDVVLKSTSVVIPVGAKSVEVPVSVSDNSSVDGERSATITAQLFVEGSNSYAGSGDRAYATTSLRVSDDEVPYLTLTSRVSTIKEGSSATITVRRYVASASGSLTVTLGSSDAGVTVPKTVTIPSGSYATTFTAQATKNQSEGDDRQVTLTAMASNIEPAALTLRVSDRTLPDAVCLSVDYDDNQFYAGTPATLYAEIGNEGTAILPTGMRIDFYLCTSSTLNRYAKSTHITTVYTERELAIGDVQKLKFTADIPQVIGDYWLYARVNGDEKIKEFSTSNNVSRVFKKVFVAAPFSVESLQTDRESYLPGELVLVTGRVSGKLNGQTVRVTLKGSGQRTYSDTKMGADGSFRTQVAIDRSAAGIMKVMALALGQTESAKQVNINVWNMTLTADKTYWTENVNYSRTGKLTLKNTSGKTITGITLTHSTLPDGCELQLEGVPQTLAAGASAVISYTVVPKKSMTGSYATFMLTAKCSEGASANLQVNYFCRATSGNLSLSPSSISTTLLWAGSRELSVKVTNYGLRATGPITLSIPTITPWLKSLSGRTLPSLAPGKSTTLYLQLTHNINMATGNTYSTSVLLSPESGMPRSLSVAVRIVGNKELIDPVRVPSHLDVYLHDVFTKSGKGAGHVSGAEIKVTNERTGQVVATGNADKDGRWSSASIVTGTYLVEASAQRHKTVKRRVVIGPDETVRTDLYLPYKAVLTNFILGANAETGEYELSSDIDIDYTAPQAIVIPTLPEAGDLGCNDTIYSMKITNVGSRAAVNMGVTLPQVPGVTLKQVSALPSVLYPQESWVVDFAYSAPESRNRRSIATMLMKYGFSINGESYSEEDAYQMLMGCGDGTETPETVVPGDGEDNPDGEDGEDDDFPIPFDDPNDSIIVDGSDKLDGTWIPLPSYNSYFRLTFEDELKDVPVEMPVKALLEVKNGQDAGFDLLGFYPTAFGYYTYEDSTDVFDVKEGEFSGFTKTADGYQLQGHTDGALHLQFVPKSEAAADGLRSYYVGGQLAYRDLGKQIRSAAALPSVKMTVKPVGKMTVMMFVQKNFLADDAATEAKEATEPAEMAVLVTNPSLVDVTDISVTNSQPSVVSSASGNQIGYELLYSEEVNDVVRMTPANSMFAKVVIDTLAAKGTSLHRFIYGTDETGHWDSQFSFSVSGKAGVKSVYAPKTLVRTVRDMSKSAAAEAGGGEMLPIDLDYKVSAIAEGNVFLVDEINDADGTPDTAWPADGSEEQTVENVTSKSEISGSAGNYILSVSATGKGWVYGRLHDPTNGKMMLTKVVRQSDGMVMSPANFWQSDRNVQSDFSIIYENNLHFADSLRQSSESYQLTFAEKPGAPAEVMRIRLFTDDGTEVHDGETTTQPVVKAIVEFTRPMRRLSYNRFSISAGETMFRSDSCSVASADNGATFTIDMTKLAVTPGTHIMSVDTEGLKDVDGQTGHGTYAISWIEKVAATAHLEMVVGPDATAGSIDKQSGDYGYGKLTLNAAAAEGYRFDQWQADGKTIARQEKLEYVVTGSATLRAVFVPIDCNVVVDCDTEYGTITGFTSGIYTWGDKLLLSAVPVEGYVLSHWLCDGEVFSEETAIRISVDGSHTYTAVFVDETTGIRDVSAPASNADTYWYTLQGVRIGQKTPTKPGIYIHCGKTVKVK